MVCQDDYSKNLIEENILRISEKKNNIYNVILYGKLEECINLEEVFKEWNVIGYIIYGNSNVHNEKVISVQEIANYNYDFILIVNENDESEILKN